jgi:uncharacterized protein with GYD domain
MPTYILLSKLVGEGSETMHRHPDRLREVDGEVKSMGCTVVAQYALLGEYDFLTVLEAPDNETVAHLSVDLASRNTVKIVTLPAIPLESFIDKLKSREQLGRGQVDQA